MRQFYSVYLDGALRQMMQQRLLRIQRNHVTHRRTSTTGKPRTLGTGCKPTILSTFKPGTIRP